MYTPDLIAKIMAGGNAAANDFLNEVARGRVRGVRSINMHARCSFVTGTFQELWEAGGAYYWPTGSAAIHLSSSDAADTSAGAGAQSVTITGLGGNYERYVETVQLNGVTRVQTTGTFYRVNLAEVSGSGAHQGNRGSISGFHNNVNQSFLMLSGSGASTLGFVTVPSGSYGVVRECWANSGFDATTRVRFSYRPGGAGQAWRNIRDWEINNWSDHEQVGAILLPPLTDIKISTQVTKAGNTTGGPVTAGVVGFIYDASADDLEPT